MHRKCFCLPFLTLTLISHVAAQDDANSARKRLATPFEQSGGWATVEYESGIRFYETLAGESPLVSMKSVGRTDSGLPLHVVLVSLDQDFDVRSVRAKGRSVLLVMNAIHPGESDGVDASMAFVRDLVFGRSGDGSPLKNVLVAVIPFYNVGGTLNRNRYTRANQNGPREYGFRGNARNYDLNRDFIKCDTLNARTFAEIFHTLDPDLLLDTHVSNGADYQHVMTTTHSQKDKLGLKLGAFLQSTFEPQLFQRMEQLGYPTIPYVNSSGNPPDDGFPQFLETPRYSTGYAALFQTIGFMTETHMLKPYPQRVEATREFLQQSLGLLAAHGPTIQQLRREDRAAYPRQERVPISWEVDMDNPSALTFHGFQSRYVDSAVTSGQRLLYDRSQPYIKKIKYFNNYVASRSVTLPAAYLIPRGWHSVIELMKLNRVEMVTLEEEAQLDAEIYRIEDFSTPAAPYEGHFFHDRLGLSQESSQIMAGAGDVLIPTNQPKARYIVETLEPAAMDSLFRWNFFDSVLQRKESFSPYVFEESAREMLNNDAKLAARFKARQEADEEFARDRPAQLEFLFRQSQHYEEAHLRYPIARILKLPSDD
jgi:hypothetical protein